MREIARIDEEVAKDTSKNDFEQWLSQLKDTKGTHCQDTTPEVAIKIVTNMNVLGVHFRYVRTVSVEEDLRFR